MKSAAGKCPECPAGSSLLSRLQAAGIENAEQEARWMRELAAKRQKDAQKQAQLLQEWCRRRCAGEPFQYIVGSASFYSIEIAVGPGVLIPRPETEELVEHALNFLKTKPRGSSILDLCTGSGAIPLAIAAERPDLHCLGIDLSPEALSWANRNRETLQPRHCQFWQGDLFTPLRNQKELPRFALITANPPYVSPDEYPKLPSVVKNYEPRLALLAEENGLALEKRIAEEAREFLLPNGMLLLEIGETQGNAVRRILEDCHYQDVQIHRDLEGKERIAQALWMG